MLVVTHEMGFAREVADRIILLSGLLQNIYIFLGGRCSRRFWRPQSASPG